MKTTTKLLCGIAAVALLCTQASAQKADTKKAFKAAAAQTEYMLKLVEQDSAGKNVAPRTFEKGQFKMVPSDDWTSGFFSGELWFLYEQNKDKKWLNEARLYTAKLEKEQHNTTTHDLGFMIYCSYGNGYRITKDENYKKVIIQAARSLITRFNPKAGVIRSWDHHGDNWLFPVIIDNMMNLELLFEATRFTGDSSFYKIAVTHANTTIKNHFRDDNSSFHVIDYDPQTGEVRNRNTAQGYADGSAWARGQAWGLYGYTMCYRETKDKRYLEQAQKIAKFILNNPNLPADMVPYWDYNAPDIPNAPRDASAAAIASSALFELAGHTGNKYYRAMADKILYNLNAQYTAPVGQNSGFILMHSTGHKPAGSEIDVPINYADYYYLEALKRSAAK